MPTLEKTTTWSDIYRDGAVFKITGEGLFSGREVLETVRRYKSDSRNPREQGIILAREHRGSGFHQFYENQTMYLENPEFELLEDIEPEYSDVKPLKRGIVFEHENQSLVVQFTDKIPHNQIPWYNFTDTGAMFLHHGFKDIFETFRAYSLPDVPRGPENEVIIARSYTRPLFVEFTTKDLSAMDWIANRKPRYTIIDPITFQGRVSGNTIYVPNMDLNE
ncbi:hypothetical protein GOV12_04110 [Candidatus Pacearchaeota archaeon]|nr:hypothetical protein [Candidatus Pacearchaeota archaeon]